MKILTVCLGNICRSPMAASVLEAVLKSEGISAEVDSAGTSAYHEGLPPDYRTIKVLNNKGLDSRHRARQIRPADIEEFDYILAMDESNLKEINNMVKKHPAPAKARIVLARMYDPAGTQEDREVPDPYYGDIKDFEQVYTMLHRTLSNFVTTLKTKKAE